MQAVNDNEPARDAIADLIARIQAQPPLSAEESRRREMATWSAAIDLLADD